MQINVFFVTNERDFIHISFTKKLFFIYIYVIRVSYLYVII